MQRASYVAVPGFDLMQRPNLAACRTAKAWFGSLPVDLLVHHVGVDICLLGPEYHCRPLSDDPDALWECTGSLGLLGDEAVLRSESVDCATEDAARQQAALALLQEYERRYSRLMQSGQNLLKLYFQSITPCNVATTLWHWLLPLHLQSFVQRKGCYRGLKSIKLLKRVQISRLLHLPNFPAAVFENATCATGIGHGDAAHSQENGHAEEVSVSKRGEAEVPPHGTIVKFGFR